MIKGKKKGKREKLKGGREKGGGEREGDREKTEGKNTTGLTLKLGGRDRWGWP